jgi:hypothetical protein
LKKIKLAQGSPSLFSANTQQPITRESETKNSTFLDISEIPQRKIATDAPVTNYSIYKDELKL